MTNAEYINELNNRLQAHPEFMPGMEFVTYPTGSTAAQASGYQWIPADVDEPMRSIAVQLFDEASNG